MWVIAAPGTSRLSMRMPNPCGLAVIVVLSVMCCLVKVGSAGEIESESDALVFLQKYGYIEQSWSAGSLGPRGLKSDDVFVEGLRQYQRDMGLGRSGSLDLDTQSMMGRPRCGMGNDVTVNVQPMSSRAKRYVIDQAWDRLELTYALINNSPFLPRSVVEEAIAKAFQAWEGVSPLRFNKPVAGATADIELQFAYVDGPGETLAYAYYPKDGGDAFLDVQEFWTFTDSFGVNMLMVLVHEIGHCLGMGHTDVQDAIMFPTYMGYQENFAFHMDDIQGIQALYGEPPVTTPTGPTIRTTPPWGPNTDLTPAGQGTPTPSTSATTTTTTPAMAPATASTSTSTTAATSTSTTPPTVWAFYTTRPVSAMTPARSTPAPDTTRTTTAARFSTTEVAGSSPYGSRPVAFTTTSYPAAPSFSSSSPSSSRPPFVTTRAPPESLSGQFGGSAPPANTDRATKVPLRTILRSSSPSIPGGPTPAPTGPTTTAPPGGRTTTTRGSAGRESVSRTTAHASTTWKYTNRAVLPTTTSPPTTSQHPPKSTKNVNSGGRPPTKGTAAPSPISGGGRPHWPTTTARVPVPPRLIQAYAAQQTLALRHQFCGTDSIDAITVYGNRTYVFQGNLYALLDQGGIAPGFPHRIQDDWPDLPDDLDAATTKVLEGVPTLLLFKGGHVWGYQDNGRSPHPDLLPGQPQMISAMFSGVPNDLDAVIAGDESHSTCFLKDGVCLNENSGDNIEPAPDSQLKQLPSFVVKDIDAGFRSESGDMHLFSGPKALVLDKTGQLIEAGYPPSLTIRTLGCQSPHGTLLT